LSNADLVEHWGLLKREIFIGIWIIISFALGLYLVGAFDRAKPMMKVKHPKNKLRFIQPILASLCFLFAAYLFSGVTYSRYANLKLLSGFPPPLSYSIYGENNIDGKGLEPNVINDYDKALQLSKQTGKPMLIDFTGWACVNCRKMEEQVWTKNEIADIIKDKFILVSLYVDDREKLPVGEQFNYKGKEIKTLGDKWATFQAVNFAQATQPLYVVLNPEEKLMSHPIGYTPDVKDYKKWLECGLTQ
ncbi:MAG TPA: thioredoxin family protein, partial [Chitinophagaceae bacterium]|nr:thioredoxin family protein [Chitinophagaceae bacterium]